jgi:hypothetical protein
VPAPASLGHDVIKRETSLDEVGPVTAAECPDLAIVIVGKASRQAPADRFGVC